MAATLARLVAEDVPLAILTNSALPRETVEALLKRLQLDGKFQSVFTSRDLASVLPCEDAYLAALSELRLPPQRVAYVGHDSIELDGAAALGLPTMAVNYECHVRADIYLDRIDQLPSLVDAAGPRILAG